MAKPIGKSEVSINGKWLAECTLPNIDLDYPAFKKESLRIIAASMGIPQMKFTRRQRFLSEGERLCRKIESYG